MPSTAEGWAALPVPQDGGERRWGYLLTQAPLTLLHSPHRSRAGQGTRSSLGRGLESACTRHLGQGQWACRPHPPAQPSHVLSWWRPQPEGTLSWTLCPDGTYPGSHQGQLHPQGPARWQVTRQIVPNDVGGGDTSGIGCSGQGCSSALCQTPDSPRLGLACPAQHTSLLGTSSGAPKMEQAGRDAKEENPAGQFWGLSPM